MDRSASAWLRAGAARCAAVRPRRRRRHGMAYAVRHRGRRRGAGEPDAPGAGNRDGADRDWAAARVVAPAGSEWLAGERTGAAGLGVLCGAAGLHDAVRAPVRLHDRAHQPLWRCERRARSGIGDAAKRAAGRPAAAGDAPQRAAVRRLYAAVHAHNGADRLHGRPVSADRTRGTCGPRFGCAAVAAAAGWGAPVRNARVCVRRAGPAVSWLFRRTPAHRRHALVDPSVAGSGVPGRHCWPAVESALGTGWGFRGGERPPPAPP
jgi:hypothetical protein